MSPTLLSTMLALLPVADGAEFFEGWGYYVGDPHVHTGASGDGGSSDLGGCSGDCGAVAELDSLARSYGLDFFVVTDHVNGDQPSSDEGFLEVLGQVLSMHDPEGGMVTVVGAEVWFSLGVGLVGHKNLYLFADNEALATLTISDVRLDGTNVLVDACEDIWTWTAQVEATWGPALLLAHHPSLAGEMATDWSCHQGSEAARLSPAVEVYSEHGDSTWAETSFDPMWLGAEEGSSVQAALDPNQHALRLGFVGGTDRHDSRPGAVCQTDTVMSQHPYGGGLTIAMVPEHETFDREPLYQALVARSTYATSGPLLPAVVEFRSGGALLGGMGEELGLPPDQPLDLEVRVPESMEVHVDSVIAVGPDYRHELDPLGGGAWTRHVSADSVPAYLYVEIVLDGDSWYGADGCDDGGDGSDEHVWLSPAWLDEGEPDLDGDGVSWGDGDCDDGDASVSPEHEERCDSGVDDDCAGLVDEADPDCEPEPEDSGRPDSPVDSGAGDSGDSPVGSDDTSGPDDEEPATCGCGGSPAGAGWLLALLPMLARRAGYRQTCPVEPSDSS